MDLLENTDTAVLSKWLSLYFAETKKQDGSRYPPKSIYMLLTGLLRHMCIFSLLCPNFQLNNFHCFKMRLTMFFDSCGQKESALSLRKHRRFWRRKNNHYGKLESSQQRIQRDRCMQFFLNGKNFCLRGGEEHCQLKLSQLKKFTDPLRYVYTENSSKNRSGGLAQMCVKNKVVPIIAVPDAAEGNVLLSIYVYIDT